MTVEELEFFLQEQQMGPQDEVVMFMAPPYYEAPVNRVTREWVPDDPDLPRVQRSVDRLSRKGRWRVVIEATIGCTPRPDRMPDHRQISATGCNFEGVGNGPAPSPASELSNLHPKGPFGETVDWSLECREKDRRPPKYPIGKGARLPAWFIPSQNEEWDLGVKPCSDGNCEYDGHWWELRTSGGVVASYCDMGGQVDVDHWLVPLTGFTRAEFLSVFGLR